MRLGQPKTNEGRDAHDRFWRQVVLWLAQQDKMEGNVYIKPDIRRLATGGQFGFMVGLRGKGGKELDDARFEVKVVGPHHGNIRRPHRPRTRRTARHFLENRTTGEFHLQVKAWRKGDNPERRRPKPPMFVSSCTRMRLRWPAELPTMNSSNRLAEAGLGQFHKAEEFPRFVQDLRHMPLAQMPLKAGPLARLAAELLSGFVVGLLLLFVTVLCLEWFLRRHWGLV